VGPVEEPKPGKLANRERLATSALGGMQTVERDLQRHTSVREITYTGEWPITAIANESQIVERTNDEEQTQSRRMRRARYCCSLAFISAAGGYPYSRS
jgi:hypothetical protein